MFCIHKRLAVTLGRGINDRTWNWPSALKKNLLRGFGKVFAHCVSQVPVSVRIGCKVYDLARCGQLINFKLTNSQSSQTFVLAFFFVLLGHF